MSIAQVDFEEDPLETTYPERKKVWSQPVTKPRRMVQAHQQAPWRIETQRGVLFLIVAILGALILWVMVSVTIQAASAGLEIQRLENDREDLARQIAGLHTEIANQTSAARMEQRAAEMGFIPVDPADITYIVLPGYRGRESIIRALPPGSTEKQPIIKPIYTQSLWEWMLQGILQVGEPAEPGRQPGGAVP
jgi:hypothetical protein